MNCAHRAGPGGRPDEITDVISFLVSKEARWITGGKLHVSAGQRFSRGGGLVARLKIRL